ncbi:MAG: PAS domain S-box protein [Tenuifilaceae bacterium]|nr:PAS domain S-box protein [Tenuifilaceae bacterium]
MSNNHKLPNLLKVYSNANFVTQQRVKFLFYLCITLLVTVLLLISLRLHFTPLGNAITPTHFANLLPLVVVFLLFIFYLFLLVRGHFITTSVLVLVPVTILSVIWFIMIFHDNQIIARLNTIAYVFMILTVLPVLVQKRNYIILLVAAVNILAVIGFTIFFKDRLNLTRVDFWDYLIDNSVAIAFVGLIGFYMNRIYTSAIEQAQTDLQKRIETEESLVESEKKYREITESLPQIIFEIDLNGRVSYINQIGLTKYGYSSDDISKDLLVTDLIVEKEILLQNIDKNIRGDLNAFKYTAIKKDKSTFPIHVFSNVILKNGEPAGLRGIAIDLTDELKAQKTIQESEERFSTAFRSNPAPMAISDIETGLFIDVNDKWVQLIGYSRDEHIGQTSEDLNYWFDKDDRLKIIRKLKENGFIKDEIVRVRTRSGMPINVKWSIEIITLNDRKVMLSLCIDETEKLKAEAELRESEERFSVSFKSSPAPLIISDIETGQIIDVNNKWVEMLGYTYSEQIGKTTKDIGIFARNEDRENLIKKLKIEGFIKDEQVNFITKSGSKIIAKWSAETITLNGKKVMLSLITNETEKVRAEELLIASERKFKETLLLLPQTVYEADLTGRLTYINKAGTDMFGYRLEDIADGVNVMETIAPEDHENVKRNISRLLTGEITQGNQYMGLRKDGSTFPMQIYSRSIINNNNVVGFRGVIFDLTQIKEVENELRQSNELFKTLIESSPISITLSDLQGRILVANNVFSKYAAQPVEYIIGKTAKEIGITTDYDDSKEALLQFKNTGIIKNFETNIFNHKGEKFFMLFSAQIVTFNGQNGFLQTSIDITDRKHLEEELKKYNEQLEFLVKERTEELMSSNEELRTTNEELYTQREHLSVTLEKLKETQEQLI